MQTIPPVHAPEAAKDTLADPRWSLLLTRDPAAEDAFVYGVTSTGIFCRPTCPARRPSPKHVRFFADPETAHQAGFRPCQRCRPGEASRTEREAALVAAACHRIEQAETEPKLSELAAQAGISRSHLSRLFRSATGLTLKQYSAAHRDRRLQHGLCAGLSITEAIYEAGYSSSGRFYASSNEVLGMTPSAYRQGGAKQTITYATGDSSLGAVLVAQGERGICAILFGDDRAALLNDLQTRFPKANLLPGDASFAGRVRQVLALVETPRLGHALPLDIQGTVFQRRVWQALQQIAPGTTISYSALAERIGSPAATRAVAQACAANSFAVAIPCHRVVRSDGSVSGYRWGLDRKRALLHREAQQAATPSGS